MNDFDVCIFQGNHQPNDFKSILFLKSWKAKVWGIQVFQHG